MFLSKQHYTKLSLKNYLQEVPVVVGEIVRLFRSVLHKYHSYIKI